ARNAVLKGLSPKDNRTIPPLRYEVVHQLKRDFSQLTIVLNGGLMDESALEHLEGDGRRPALDGVMLGREAWHRPRVLTELAQRLWPESDLPEDRGVVAQMQEYAQRQVEAGVPLRVVVRPLLGFTNGMKGARRWRQMLSDPKFLSANDASVIR